MTTTQTIILFNGFVHPHTTPHRTTQHPTKPHPAPQHHHDTTTTTRHNHDYKTKTTYSNEGDWKVEESEYVRVSGDRGLVVGSVAKHHAIGALFPTLLDTTGKDLVVQYPSPSSPLFSYLLFNIPSLTLCLPLPAYLFISSLQLC
jgi:Calreticulin family